MIRDTYGEDIQTMSRAALRALQEGHESVMVTQDERLGDHFADYFCARAQNPAVPRDTAHDIARWSILWVIHGMPKVVVDHGPGGHFATTEVPAEFCDQVRAPWKFFAVSVPPGLIGDIQQTALVEAARIPSEDGEREGARVIYAQYDVNDWRGPVSNQRICAPWSEFAKPALADEFEVEKLKRSAQCIMRFVFGVVSELQGRESELRAACGKYPPRVKRGEPRCWTVRIARPVKCDVRKAVYAYVRGDGRSLTKQGVVMGHWKRQPHGPGAAQRKFIHVEAYWRGPEDAPIAVRPHILRGGDRETGA